MVTQIRCSRSNTQTRHSAGVHGTHLLAARLHLNCGRPTKRGYVVTCCPFSGATRFQGFSIDAIKAKHAARHQHARPKTCIKRGDRLALWRESKRSAEDRHEAEDQAQAGDVLVFTQREFGLTGSGVLNVGPGDPEASKATVQEVKTMVALLSPEHCSWEAQRKAFQVET